MGWAEEKRKILIRPLHRRYAAEPPRRGSQVNKALNIAFPSGGRCWANAKRMRGVAHFWLKFYIEIFNQGAQHIFDFLNISGEISEKQGAQLVFLYFQKFENVTAPHQSAPQTASPRGEASERGWAFLPKKMKFTEFFFRQGEASEIRR